MLREYLARTPGSRALHDRFVRSLPGGETRAVTHFAPYPIVLKAGRGACVVDVDGNEYVDVLNNYTSLVHGNAFPPVLEAIARSSAGGTALASPHEAQLELAELLVARYPAVELVRFTNSGTEAAVLAGRIARRATGRPGLVLFEGGYHGSAPEFLGEGENVRRVPFGDVAALEAVMDGSVAAVFVEPFLGSGGVIPARDGFLAAVSAICASRGAVFVLDEVQSLRSAVEGVHGQLGLRPGLVLMGKTIGGGLPVGAVGGDAGLLQLTAAGRARSLAHSGTFNGNPVVCAAGIVALQHLDQDSIRMMNERAARVAEGIEAAAAASGCQVSVTRSGSIMHVHMAASRNSADLHLGLLLEGVYAAPRGMLNLSTVVTDETCAMLVDGYRRAFVRLAEAAAVGTGSC